MDHDHEEFISSEPRRAGKTETPHDDEVEVHPRQADWDALTDAAQTIFDLSLDDGPVITPDVAKAALKVLGFGFCRMDKNVRVCNICPTIPYGQLPGDLTPEELAAAADDQSPF